MAQVAVIVPGAGSGRRFGGRENKIFARIAGQPMFLRTLEAFTSRNDVCQCLLVCSPDDLPMVRETYGGHMGFLGVELIEGGSTRSRSVHNALQTVTEKADLIAVHDAARPCIAQPWIDAVFHEAEKYGAAILARRIHGTVKRADDSNRIHATLPRNEFADLWEAQTPQVFRADWLKEAYETGREATDDAALLEALGKPVSVVPGDPRNIKITTKEDLHFAAAVVSSLPKPKPARGLHPFAD